MSSYEYKITPEQWGKTVPFSYFSIDHDLRDIQVAFVYTNTRGTKKFKILKRDIDYTVVKTRVKNLTDVILLKPAKQDCTLKVIS
jgi:hypothetical protein